MIHENNTDNHQKQYNARKGGINMDIKSRYSIELDEIRNYLTDLENGRIYELTGTPGTASCATLAKHLRDNLNSLLNKIEKDKPSVAEIVAESSRKM